MTVEYHSGVPNEARKRRLLASSGRPEAPRIARRDIAIAVLFAVLAAIIIVYRTGESDIHMASNDIMPAAAQADPVAPPPILPR